MRKIALIAALLAAACSEPQSPTPPLKTAVARAVITDAECATAETFGATANDGLDDRIAIQTALNTGCLRLGAGQYDVVTPPAPRVLAMLIMPSGGVLRGVGEASVVRFSGDNSKKDWRGIQHANGSRVERVRLVTDFIPGTTVEQTHVQSIVGPIADVKVMHTSCDHPQRTSKSGDCVQLICYPPTVGQSDKLCWDVEIGYLRVDRAGRSGVAVHSGLRGTFDQTTGHWTSRIHHSEFHLVSDQDVDGEGTGGTDGVEIDHNHHFFTPGGHESTLAIQVQASARMWFHDNVSDGRGVDVLGCDHCRFSDNVITQVQAGDGAQAIRLRNLSQGVVFENETYTRMASAGLGPVIALSVKDGAPQDIRISDSHVTQMSAGTAITVIGIQGLEIDHVRVDYNGPVKQADAINVIGSGTAGCASGGVRSDRIRVTNLVAVGATRAVVSTSGSYCGTGSFDIQRVSAIGSNEGLRCENVTTGAGVTGPITYADNSMPAMSSVCNPLIH